MSLIEKYEVCGECKWLKWSKIDKAFVCMNPASEYCYDETEYDDTCEEWEEE